MMRRFPLAVGKAYRAYISSNPLWLDHIPAIICRLLRNLLLYFIVMVGNHGFTDVNIRTSWILVEILIERSGYYLDIDDDDEPIEDLVVKVASTELNFDDLKAWFAPRLIRR
jgi:hypothetical protein